LGCKGLQVLPSEEGAHLKLEEGAHLAQEHLVQHTVRKKQCNQLEGAYLALHHLVQHTSRKKQRNQLEGAHHHGDLDDGWDCVFLGVVEVKRAVYFNVLKTCLII